MRKLIVVLAVLFAPAATTAVAEEESAPGYAYEKIVHPQPVAELFAAAVKHGGYTEQCKSEPESCQAPLVLLMPMEDGVDGKFYYREPNFIQVNIELTPGTLRFNETVVHEFVHYLQFSFGEYSPRTKCWDMGKIEERAYLAGAAYLKETAGVVQDYSTQIAWQHIMSAMCRGG